MSGERRPTITLTLSDYPGKPYSEIRCKVEMLYGEPGKGVHPNDMQRSFSEKYHTGDKRSEDAALEALIKSVALAIKIRLSIGTAMR